MRLLTARYLLPTPDRWIEGGGLLVRRGRIARLLAGPRAVARAAAVHGLPPEDQGDVVLAAGLVNAHAHLELGLLRDQLPADRGFAAWVAALIEARERAGAAAAARGLVEGVRRLLATGTTAAGDIDASDAHDRADAGPLRVRRYREVLDARDPLRRAAVLFRVRRRLPPTRSRWEGISPHAPFTASDELLRRAGEIARRRRIPLQVHWAESEEETLWLATGGGPFAPFLPPSPRRTGLDLLFAAGLLGPATALVHGNHPARGEMEKIAARGTVLIHCPGTHAFFGREPFPWRRWRRAGVMVALGSDSLASNADLDLRREMALARAGASSLDPAEVWAMGTSRAARALGLADRLGELLPGREADVAAIAGLAAAGRRPALDALTSGAGRVSGLWIGGQPVALPAGGSGGPLARPAPGRGARSPRGYGRMRG
ncbi:MAG: amidohydrolase family protein [Planctomycetota bacterium]